MLLHDKVQIAVSRLLRGGFRLQERILGQAPRAERRTKELGEGDESYQGH